MGRGDELELEHATITNHAHTERNKALLLQLRGRVTTGGGYDSTFGPVYAGSWAVIAPPAAPDADPQGNVGAAAETYVVREGDVSISLGQRDVRWAKFASDLKAGESAFINAFGWRLVLQATRVAIEIGGAFLALDKGASTVTLSGFASGGAAKVVLTSGAKLVSASGAASVDVDGANATIKALAIALNATSIGLGDGASDPVVTVSTLQPILTVLFAHLASLPGAPPPPVLAIARGSSRVKAVP